MLVYILQTFSVIGCSALPISYEALSCLLPWFKLSQVIGKLVISYSQSPEVKKASGFPGSMTDLCHQKLSSSLHSAASGFQLGIETACLHAWKWLPATARKRRRKLFFQPRHTVNTPYPQVPCYPTVDWKYLGEKISESFKSKSRICQQLLAQHLQLYLKTIYRAFTLYQVL